MILSIIAGIATAGLAGALQRAGTGKLIYLARPWFEDDHWRVTELMSPDICSAVATDLDLNAATLLSAFATGRRTLLFADLFDGRHFVGIYQWDADSWITEELYQKSMLETHTDQEALSQQLEDSLNRYRHIKGATALIEQHTGRPALEAFEDFSAIDRALESIAGEIQAEPVVDQSSSSE